MALSFVKLFSSLPESTIWTEPYHVRIMWITMLSVCDRDGKVFGSVPGMAKRANVTVAESEEAIRRLMEPDRFSQSPEEEGRRIRQVEGGWQLINYEKYRQKLSAEAVKAAKRRWWDQNKARYRTQKEPKPAAHSPENAAQAIQESRQAAQSAVPMPEAIRANLAPK